MLTVPSSQLCVPLASGGDPTYAFNVKLSGEEVHGTSERRNECNCAYRIHAVLRQLKMIISKASFIYVYMYI